MKKTSSGQDVKEWMVLSRFYTHLEVL